MLTFWPLCKRLLCHLDAVNWIPQWFRVSRVLGYLLPSGLTLYIYLSNTASGSKRVFWRSSQWRVALLWGYICLVHRLSNKPVCYTDVFRQENSAPWLRMDLPGWYYVPSTKREGFHNTWVLIYTSLFLLEFLFLRGGVARRIYSFSSKISLAVSDCSSFQQVYVQRFYSRVLFMCLTFYLGYPAYTLHFFKWMMVFPYVYGLQGQAQYSGEEAMQSVSHSLFTF